jgi:hypothetical protein
VAPANNSSASRSIRARSPMVRRSLGGGALGGARRRSISVGGRASRASPMLSLSQESDGTYTDCLFGKDHCRVRNDLMLTSPPRYCNILQSRLVPVRQSHRLRKILKTIPMMRFKQRRKRLVCVPV